MDLNSQKWRAGFQAFIRLGVFLSVLFLYLNLALNLYISRQKILKLQHEQQALQQSFQQVQSQNQRLKMRLHAKDDPYYVEFLLRKKLKMKRPSEITIPLNLQNASSLLME